MADRDISKIPIIRKGVYLDYLKPGVMGGVLIGTILFFLALINNSPSRAFYFGLTVCLGVISFYMALFAREEYFERKRKIKKLLSAKYDFLFENGFCLYDDLLLEGFYNGFYFRIPTFKRSSGESVGEEYHVIQTFFVFNPTSDDPVKDELKKQQDMTGDYYLGRVTFDNHVAALLPKDWKEPDFKENFDEFIVLLERLKLKAIPKDKWIRTYGAELEPSNQKEKDTYDKAIRIGKLTRRKRKKRRKSR